MEDKILTALKRKEGYLSGDSLSERLGVSRQALWKHIQELKNAGYDIIAVPHLGYKLASAPDRLFPVEIQDRLNTRLLGQKIHYFDSLSSTMNLATELGIKGSGEGTIVIAESQSRGRGRLARPWFSPKYKGIYLSLILRPRILPSKASLLTLLTAVSICEAVKAVADLDCQIKWPNDILIHNKKAGGILTELNAETDKTNFVVIGIGLNVNNDKKSLVSGATSLREQRKDSINRVALLQEILRRIEHNYYIFNKKGSSAIIDKWREYNNTLGRRVKVYCQKEQIEGEAADIEEDGGLLIRKDTGIIKKVMAGDVMHCR